MSKMNITPYITSEDLSRLPDQASFKLNTLIDNLTAEIIDREKGDNEGSEALQRERDARINADDNLNSALQDEANARIDADTAIENRISGLIDIFYPIGSYYETSNTSFNPNTAWGGTWVEDTKGRVTVAKADSGTFATVGAQGGSETVTLTLAQVPEHGHNVHTWNGNTQDSTARVYNESATSNAISNAPRGFRFTGNQGSDDGWFNSGFRTSDGRIGAESGAGDVSGMTSKKGGGGSHNNLQPYKVVKRWHRTA